MANNENQKLKIKNQKCGVLLRGMASLCLIFNILYLIFVSGCVQQKRSCPAIETAIEGQKMLSDYAASILPIKATGNCTLTYFGEKGKKFRQSFPIRIWYLNNQKFCIYGDVLFNPQGVCFAVNNGEYWTYARPLGLYVKGAVNKAGDDYFSNPALLVDFLSSANSECEKMPFTKNGITCKSGQKRKQKKIYIDTCSKAANKIVYVGQNSKASLTINAEKYEKVSDGDFLFPTKLNYEYYDKKNGRNQMEIKLDSVKLWHPDGKQLSVLFTPPAENEIKKETK